MLELNFKGAYSSLGEDHKKENIQTCFSIKYYVFNVSIAIFSSTNLQVFHPLSLQSIRF